MADDKWVTKAFRREKQGLKSLKRKYEQAQLLPLIVQRIIRNLSLAVLRPAALLKKLHQAVFIW